MIHRTPPPLTLTPASLELEHGLGLAHAHDCAATSDEWSAPTVAGEEHRNFPLFEVAGFFERALQHLAQLIDQRLRSRRRRRDLRRLILLGQAIEVGLEHR